MNTPTPKYPYHAETCTASLPLAQYIDEYRDVEKFLPLCQACQRYGRTWSCPPFQHNTTEQIGHFHTATIVAVKITPLQQQIPLAHYFEVIRPERVRIEQLLRKLEEQHSGLAFGFAGSCPYCPPDTCTRASGQPCRHPHLVRPSLEAYGFDLGKTTTQLFQIPLLWSTDGYLPAYTTLISGLFHSAKTEIQLDTSPSL